MSANPLANLLAAIRAQTVGDIARLQRAAVYAVNDTAFDIMRAARVDMAASLDRPRPTTTNAIQVERAGLDGPIQGRTRKGLPKQLRGVANGVPLAAVATVYVDDTNFDAVRILAPHVRGGSRAFKSAERRLTAIGAMRAGDMMVPSAATLSDHGDGYGNVRGPFIRRLLSYFAAFTEPGFVANMSQRGKDRLARRRRTPSGGATIEGVQYFISHGRGERTGAGTWRNGRHQHLSAGIYARRGIHGVSLTPVFLFVRDPRYRIRWRFEDVAHNTAIRSLPARLQQQFQRVGRAR